MGAVYLGILLFLLSACSRSISTPPVTATAYLFPAQSPESTEAIVLELKACVATDESIRIRQGPGIDYETIGALAPGACITILGRSTDSSWAFIITADSFTCWVAAWLLTIDGDMSKLTVRPDTADLVALTEIPPLQSVQSCSNIANPIGSSVTCKLETAYCVFLHRMQMAAQHFVWISLILTNYSNS